MNAEKNGGLTVSKSRPVSAVAGRCHADDVMRSLEKEDGVISVYLEIAIKFREIVNGRNWQEKSLC